MSRHKENKADLRYSSQEVLGFVRLLQLLPCCRMELPCDQNAMCVTAAEEEVSQATTILRPVIHMSMCAGETLGTGSGMSLQRGIPGIGEFQCYDKYMMADLKKHAESVSEPEW